MSIICPPSPSLGFRVWRGQFSAMRGPHSHPDFEVNFLHAGHVVYLHGGSCVALQAGHFTVFWAGLPHVTIEQAPDTQVSWITVPLADAMRWDLPPGLIGELLLGRMVQAKSLAAAELDALLLRQWEQDFRESDAQRRLARAEIAARLQRLACSNTPLPAITGKSVGARKTAARAFEYVAQNYPTVASAGVVAEAIGAHPKYLIQSFKRTYGIGIWDYVMRMRIAHSQRQLLTTNQPVDVVADACGFRTVSAFYRAFSRFSDGISPARFRRLG